MSDPEDGELTDPEEENMVNDMEWEGVLKNMVWMKCGVKGKCEVKVYF